MQILVADDEPVSSELLAGWLKKWGYKPVVCRDGAAAWKLLGGGNPPRVALLDWTMPGLSGPEICRRLRARGDEIFVYTILVTARDDEQEQVQGLSAGAYDYISKPVAPEILRERVGIGARLARENQALADITRVLDRHALMAEQAARERTRQLLQADRMCTLGTMSAGIAHEINNPLSFISGNIQSVEKFWRQIEPELTARLRGEPPRDSADKLRYVLDNFPKRLGAMREGLERVAKIVRDLSSYSRPGSGAKRPTALNDCISRALALSRSTIKNKVTAALDLAPDLPEVNADAQQIEQVLLNLILNAAQAMEGQPDARLQLRSAVEGESVLIEVRDNGPGIPLDKLDLIWKAFFTTKEPGRGTGLGLAISRQIVQDHGGTVTAANDPAGGAVFAVRLPACSSAA